MPFLDRLKGIMVKDASPLEEMQAQMALGDLFKTWINTDIGRYIVGRADQYEYDILRKLGETDPKDTTQIIRLQTEARLPGRIKEWISDAIEAGEAAKFQLHQDMEYNNEGE